ncbi:hypothetical protein ACCS96_30910 [Rhizobium ruizarguesonis]
MNRSSVFAYVTLVTNADYAMGATALARSLRRTGTGADIVILHTGGELRFPSPHPAL